MEWAIFCAIWGGHWAIFYKKNLVTLCTTDSNKNFFSDFSFKSSLELV
jgi:hypothetical protein